MVRVLRAFGSRLAAKSMPIPTKMMDRRSMARRAAVNMHQLLFPNTFSAQLVPLDSRTLSLFYAVQNFYVTNNHSTYVRVVKYVSGVNVSAGTGRFAPMSGTREMDAFDMVQTPAYRQMAIDTQTNFSHFDAYPNVIRAAAGTVLNLMTSAVKVPLIMQITLEFPDHSTSVIQFDFNVGKFFYVPESSKDAMGNPIPENASQVAGQGSKNYIFQPGAAGADAAIRQSRNAQRYGVYFPSEIYHSAWIVACVNAGSGTSCQISHP